MTTSTANKQRKTFSQVSLRVKLPIWISILVILVLAGTSIFSYMFASKLLLAKSSGEIDMNAERIGENLYSIMKLEEQSSYLTSVQDTSKDLLKLRNQKKLSDTDFFSAKNDLQAKTNAILAQSLKGSPGMQTLSLVDTQGLTVASSNPGSVKVDLSDREYLKEALQGKFTISDALYSKTQNILVTVFAQPVKDEDGKVLGVYIGTINTSLFVENLKNVKINRDGRVFVASRQGTIIYHSAVPDMVGQKLDADMYAEVLKPNPTDGMLQGNIASKDTYFRYVKIPKSDWTVVVADEYADINKPLDDLFKDIVIAALIAFVIAIAAGLLLSRTITSPIVKLTDLFKKLSEGDLTVQAEGKFTSEFGQLAANFNVMAEKNKLLIAGMNSSIEVLNESTNELEQTSKNASQSINETSVTTTEIATAMESQSRETEQIASKFYDLGEKIAHLNSRTQFIKERSEAIIVVFHENREIIESLIEVNGKNEQEVQKISSSTAQLVESSNHIRNITGAIGNIAKQTNLLALNASIEAARAGEHGKGFAVVAEEIRKLAEQSSQQSGVINEIIQQTLEQVDENNQSVSEIHAIAVQANEFVEKTRQSFETIIEHVTDIIGQIKSMADEVDLMEVVKDEVVGSSQNLSASGEQVSASVEEVSATIQEQSALIQKLAAMVESIDSLTNELANSASQFKVK